MLRQTLLILFVAAELCLGAAQLNAQERVKPKAAAGGEKQGAAWADVPETFRHLKFPIWPVPTDAKRWQEVDRAAVRATLIKELGEMPARPDPAKVKVVSREDKGDYTLERFEFHNGVDMVVPGYILIPKNLRHAAPAIIGMHGRGSSKESICTDEKHGQFVGPMLAKNGYVVAAIDAYLNGDRIGKGPAGAREQTQAQELTLFKLNLWLGRTLWGMMLRDEQCLIDYLETRPEVDRRRIAGTGMSMGCTRAWWLAAIDERIQAIVGVACFTRYEELIAQGNLAKHGIYYFVPGILQHFDTEAIYALVAPRPMLMLSGDQDGGAPTDGVQVLEAKLGAVYRLYGQPERFRSVVYEQTGHEYLPEMKDEMLAWFQRYLPVSAGN